MNSITRTATLALLIAALAGGCNFKNKQRIAAHQRWDQTRARVMCSVGTQHLKVGDLAKAEDSASKALALDPDCGPALVLLGKVLLEKGRYLQAEKHLREAELGSPDNAEVPYLLGVALEKRGRYTEALKCYQKARALAPANDAYVLASAEVLVAAGKPKLALELLTARLERTDGEAPMLALAGEVALLVDQPGRAGEFFRRCLDVAPEALGAREGLAKASFFARQYAQALAALKELSADEDYKEKVSWVYIMSGHCQMALNRPRQAWESYRVASQIDPAEANIWTCLAKAGLAAGDARAAEQAARRALALTADDADATVALAYAMLAQGRGADAAEMLTRAARTHREDPVVLCVLGRCYEAVGRKADAAKCYVQALRADPEHELAKKLLASAGIERLREP